MGEGAACGTTDAGYVHCWGGGWDPAWRAPAYALSNVRVGKEQACGLTDSGRVLCWGSGEAPGGEPRIGEPPTGMGFTEVDLGSSLACAVDAAGQVACWHPTWGARSAPFSQPAEGIAVGRHDLCARVGSDDTLTCVAANSGDEWWDSESPPSAVVQASAFHRHACGLTADSEPRCWLFLGDEGVELGGMVSDVTEDPVHLLNASYDRTCTIAPEGELSCHPTSPAEPIRFDVAEGDLSVGSTIGALCALEGGTIECWLDAAVDADGWAVPTLP